MVELRILGTVRLQATNGNEVEALVRRAKRTALLAYLAAALPRGPHRRDTLFALFWPESDAAHAQAALNQALYVLRSALGDNALVSQGDTAVGLSERVVWCDAAAFEAALDAGRPREALALYRGDLLEGFFITGAPEFERWLERERVRLRERAAEGAWAAAAERAAAGDAVEAERWARRAAELLPPDETVARRLMTFLHRLGDRAAAIRAYEEFAARLAQEYELQPSAETQALAATIREEEGESVPRARPAELAKAQAAGPTPPPPARLKRAATLLAVVLASLLAGAWLVLGTPFGARSAAARDPKKVVVLPFTNLGPPEDEYFADGITEEIAARLGAIDRLRVIGRTSANRYKRTQKSIPEIGQELGVGYVLEGSVRWEKTTRGETRVRVTLQLLSTADGMHLWAAVYDEPLTEIFRVQSDIARKVVHALGVTLLEPQRRAIEAAPTANIEAYDYYLRGNEYMLRLEPRYARAAVQMYEQAVELDPSFALAYARLGRINGRMYARYYDRSEGRLAQAKRAVDRAFELRPDLPEVHLALGMYYWQSELDTDRALRELAIAEAGLPNETDVFVPRSAVRLQGLGDPDGAFVDLEKAWLLDPGAFHVARERAFNRDFARDYERAEALYDDAIKLSPDDPFAYYWKAGLYLRWQGSTEKARAVLDQARAIGLTTDPPWLLGMRVRVDFFDHRYEEARRELASDAPEVIAGDLGFVPRAQLYAELHGLMRRPDLERAYYDSARSVVSRRLQERPDDPRLRSALGIAYAGLGRKHDAIREGQRGVGLMPISKQALFGYYRAWDLARILTMVGEHEAAVERLEHLLSIPGHLTPAWLRVDPTWDPLRSHPRFQKLVNRRE